jgi:hypothetical protein
MSRKKMEIKKMAEKTKIGKNKKRTGGGQRLAGRKWRLRRW